MVSHVDLVSSKPMDWRESFFSVVFIHRNVFKSNCLFYLLFPIFFCHLQWGTNFSIEAIRGPRYDNDQSSGWSRYLFVSISLLLSQSFFFCLNLPVLLNFAIWNLEFSNLFYVICLSLRMPPLRWRRVRSRTTIGQRHNVAQKMLQLCRMSSAIGFNIGMRWTRSWNPLPLMLRQTLRTKRQVTHSIFIRYQF